MGGLIDGKYLIKNLVCTKITSKALNTKIRGYFLKTVNISVNCLVDELPTWYILAHIV